MRRVAKLAIIISTCLGATMEAKAVDGCVTSLSSQARMTSPTPADQALARMAPSLLARDWSDYKRRFVSPDGRVIDTGNGGISHSEGQGYGMLLALLMRDPATFERIWHWTRTELLIRRDGLAAWKWDAQLKRVTDQNNATDGDILIAWALGEAALAFARPDYATAGRGIALAIGKTLVRPTSFGPVLLPGVDGFEADADSTGPTLNLSYWVYPAFPTLQRLASEIDWDRIVESGHALLRAAQFGPARLPPDWITLVNGQPQLAKTLPNRFSYNAIRIPLYLLLAKPLQPGDLEPFAALARDGAAHEVDVTTGVEGAVMGGAGFRLLLAASRCVCSGQPISDIKQLGTDDAYFPATLALLGKWLLIQRYPQCL